MNNRGMIRSLIIVVALLVMIIVPHQSDRALASDGDIQDQIQQAIDDCDIRKLENILSGTAPVIQLQPASELEAGVINAARENLRSRMSQILLDCLTKELASIDCSRGACSSKSLDLAMLREDIYVEYFWDPVINDRWSSEHLRVAEMRYKEKLAKCYQDLLKNCDCNIEGLVDLWADLNIRETPVYFEQIEVLNQQIGDMIRGCYEKKLEQCNCDINCLRALWADVWLGGDLAVEILEYQHITALVEQIRDLMRECYEKKLEQCNCDLDCLRALWADVWLDDVTSSILGEQYSIELGERILEKYEECLEKEIAAMDDIERMIELVLKRDTLKLREDALHDVYRMALAVLKRISQIHGLGINFEDDHFNECCDHVLYLKHLYLLVKEYQSENMMGELRDHPIIKDPYAYCRILVMQELTKDCSPKRFCEALQCGLYGYWVRDSIQECLDNPREQRFLEALNERIEECIGHKIDLRTLKDFCVHSGDEGAWEKYVKPEGEPGKTELVPLELEPGETTPEIIRRDEEPEGEKGETQESIDRVLERVQKLLGEAEDNPADVETEMVPLELAGTEPSMGPIEVRIEIPQLEQVEPAEGEETTGALTATTSASYIDIPELQSITRDTGTKVVITAPIIDETSGEAKEVIIEIESLEVTLIGGGDEAKTTLPLVIQDNKLYFGQDQELHSINLLPGEIGNQLETPPKEICLELDEDYGPVYEISLEEEAKLLFLPVLLTRNIIIDPTSGEVLGVEKPWWSFIVAKTEIPETFYAPLTPMGP